MSYSVEQVTESIKAYINIHCIFRADNAIQYAKDLPPGKLYGKHAGTTNSYLFLLRNLTQNPIHLQHVSVLMYKRIIDYLAEKDNQHPISQGLPIQLAGMETAALPLLAGISLVGLKAGMGLNTFAIRKERKRYGLHNYIDGMPNSHPVVIIDDLINSGQSIVHCQQVIKHELDLPVVDQAFSIVRFQTEKFVCGPDCEIKVNSLFTADQFDRVAATSTVPADCTRTKNKRPDYM